MANVAVLNTDAGLSAKTLITAEGNSTVTGTITFDKDPSAPFAVSAGSSVVTNLDADKLDGIEGADLVKKDGTVSMTGKLNLGTIGQLQFPATQNASTDVNCLDDYEEGSWTPVIGGATSESGQTYTTQDGTYIKIGKLVLARFDVTLSAKGTITGDVMIKGLPFTVAGGATAGTIAYFTALGTSWVWIAPHAQNATTRAAVYGTTAAATGVTALVAADISNTTRLIGAVTYQANA